MLLLSQSHWPEAPCFWKSPWSGNFWLLDNMRSSRLWWPQQLKPHPDTAAVKRREGNTSQGSGGSILQPIRFKPRLYHYFSICKYAKKNRLMKSYWQLTVCLIYAIPGVFTLKCTGNSSDQCMKSVTISGSFSLEIYAHQSQLVTIVTVTIF